MTINRNRLANVNNQFQGGRKRVLCVCSAGLLRSPTAAWILSNEPFGYNTRAVGSSEEYALIQLDAAHVKWADVIVVMDENQAKQVEKLRQQLADSTGFWPTASVHVINVPDIYGYREPELVEIMTRVLSDIFEVE